jgi:hypothetical protein
MTPIRWHQRIARGALGAALVLASACGDDGSTSPSSDRPGTTASDASPRFPDVIDVDVERGGDYDFTVTISSPYDSPDRYADGWRIMGADGTVYGEHELLHDHASEQPFTRTQSGVSIPQDVDEVIVEARDLRNGYGGETVTVTLPDG